MNFFSGFTKRIFVNNYLSAKSYRENGYFAEAFREKIEDFILILAIKSFIQRLEN